MLDLCQSINLPREITKEVLSLSEALDTASLNPYIVNLLSPEKASETYKELKRLLGEDERGYKLLTVYLKAALLTKKAYAEKGIPETVFTDTLKCLTRFCEEHKISFSVYGFDRGWWAYRQLSLRLFRLGTLEFEMKDDVLAVHIPSDAVLTKENLKASYERAKNFFTRYFCDFSSMECDTWLLSPALGELLPKGSRILNFRADYEILSVSPDQQEFMIWVYKKKFTDIDALPEETSLQQSIKKHLQAGGKIGSALGRYIKR